MERHTVRCPNVGMRQLMHDRLVGFVRSVLKDVGIPDSAIVTEARGLKSADAIRHGDVVVLIFVVEGRHMVIDAVVTTKYRNTAFPQVVAIPGYAAKQAEDRKFYVDKTFHQPIATVYEGPRVFVTFAVEDGGRLEAHALALFKALATVALEKSRQPSHAYRFHKPPAPTLASLWTQRWQQRISSWLHLAISKHVIRLVFNVINTPYTFI